jgi:hypothetical protein
MKRIALHRADHRQRYADATGRVFDDGAVPPQASVRLRRIDHGERHPVLHAVGWIFGFQLQQQAGSALLHHVVQSDQGGMANALQDVRTHLAYVVFPSTSTVWWTVWKLACRTGMVRLLTCK